MHFGKSLLKICDLSDPEWGPYWMNYKVLKRKIKEIVESRGGAVLPDVATTTTAPSSSSSAAAAAATAAAASNPRDIAKSAAEVEFFRVVRAELRKTTEFFASTEKIFQIRYQRVRDGLTMLQRDPTMHDKNTWSRLLHAIVKFYRDALMLENFAIMNYCAFSKILKKHDKVTGFRTRDAFMRNVMSAQNITHYPCTAELLRGSEKLFTDIEQLESCMPLQDEERLFIETMRELNRQASRIQAGEQENFKRTMSCDDLTQQAATTTPSAGAAPAVVTGEDAAAGAGAGASPASVRSVMLLEGLTRGRTTAVASPRRSRLAGGQPPLSSSPVVESAEAADGLGAAAAAALTASQRLEKGRAGVGAGAALMDDEADAAAGAGAVAAAGAVEEEAAAALGRGRRRGAPQSAAAAGPRKRVK